MALNASLSSISGTFYIFLPSRRKQLSVLCPVISQKRPFKLLYSQWPFSSLNHIPGGTGKKRPTRLHYGCHQLSMVNSLLCSLKKMHLRANIIKQAIRWVATVAARNSFWNKKLCQDCTQLRGVLSVVCSFTVPVNTVARAIQFRCCNRLHWVYRIRLIVTKHDFILGYNNCVACFVLNKKFTSFKGFRI